MRSFHGDPEARDVMLHRVEHMERGWGRGEEAVTDLLGDTFSSQDLARCLGLPRWLIEAEPRLHAGLSSRERQQWPRRFLEAIPVGVEAAELNRLVLAPFVVSVLRHALTTFNTGRAPAVRASVELAIRLWERDDLGSAAWLAASAEAGRTTWRALSPIPETDRGALLPGQEEVAAAYRAALLASELTAEDSDVDPATVAVWAALGYVEPSRLGQLARELLSLLQWLGPAERGDDMLRAVTAAHPAPDGR